MVHRTSGEPNRFRGKARRNHELPDSDAISCSYVCVL